MQIGKVIRKYRKEKGITQEEMARRLGVTAPAVNKWENGNSFPDITLLAPIARLLDINVDTLLSFQEELSGEEINQLIYEIDNKLKSEPYEVVFHWVKRKIEKYPNCNAMILWSMQILDAQRTVKTISDAEKYDEEIIAYYSRVLESQDETLRTSAASSIYCLYLRKGQYEQAESYLSFLSDQNPEKKRRQAEIYSKTNRIIEAYKAYEELLFSEYQRLSLVLNSIYMLSLQEKNMEKAYLMIQKQSDLAKLFEMGIYQETIPQLDLAKLEKDDERVQKLGKKLLDACDTVTDFRKSSLYEHMKFKGVSKEFIEEIKSALKDNFKQN